MPEITLRDADRSWVAGGRRRFRSFDSELLMKLPLVSVAVTDKTFWISDLLFRLPQYYPVAWARVAPRDGPLRGPSWSQQLIFQVYTIYLVYTSTWHVPVIWNNMSFDWHMPGMCHSEVNVIYQAYSMHMLSGSWCHVPVLSMAYIQFMHPHLNFETPRIGLLRHCDWDSDALWCSRRPAAAHTLWKFGLQGS